MVARIRDADSGAGGDEDLRITRSAIFSLSVHFSPLRAKLFVSQ